MSLAQLRLLLLALTTRTGRAAKLTSVRSRWGRGSQRTYQLAGINSSHTSRLVASRTGSSLDGRTWADLNLDDVFASLDHTNSTLGQHALYHRLRTISPNGDGLSEFESLTTLVTADPSVREHAQLALLSLQDPYGYDLWWLAQSDAAEPRRWHSIYPLLSLAALCALVAALYWPWALLLLLINIVVRYATDRQLLAIASCFRQFAPLIVTAESLARVSGALPNSPETLRRLQGDVSKLGSLKWISRWTGGNPLMLSLDANRWAIAAGDFLNAIYEYLNLMLLLDATGVFIATRKLHRDKSALLRVIAAIGELDAAISIASYRASRTDWTRPKFLAANGTATFEQLSHPLVPTAVPNSIVIGPSHGVLITGSNMAGKSTFLRTLGVNVVLAQTVNTCIAGRYEAPWLAVRSCIGRADDLLAGKSYHLVEVEALIELMDASNDEANHLFLLDELFRGTNAVERIAAAQAVLCELVGNDAAAKPHYVLAATHDGELGGMLPRFEPFHFDDRLGPDGLVFDYTLRPGLAKSRTAIKLLQLHGAPASMIEQALSTAKRLDHERNIEFISSVSTPKRTEFS